MARRRHSAQQMMVDGQQMVVMDPGDFAVLDSCRRQMGALQTRASRAKRELASMRVALAGHVAAAAAAAAAVASLACVCRESAACGRCRALALLTTQEKGD